jgi:hypothetical protein
MQIIPDEFLPGFGPEEPKPSSPKTAEEWCAKRLEITRLFSPTAPVQAGVFVGRTSQITKVTEGILKGGQHVGNRSNSSKTNTGLKVVPNTEVILSIKQIGMPPRMSEEEIREIVRVGLSCAGMDIDNDAISLIVWLARGMPAVARLLGMNSAKVAIDHKTLMITESFVISALQSCLDEVDKKTRETYARAIRGRRSKNRYWKIILSCATVLLDEQEDLMLHRLAIS